jgi:hypothetical protein
MRHAKVARLSFAAVAATLMAACMAASSSDNGSPRDKAERGGDDGGTSSPSAGAADPGPLASGIIIVHAATFPSFRLCFGNYLDRPPMPDSKIMPQANVVGVEMGSLVRLDSFTKPPGKVYVVVESEVRSTPGNSNELSCGERLGLPKPTSKTDLVLDNDYHLTPGSIDQPLGVGKVSVLAISGCGSLPNVRAIDRTNPSPRDDESWRTLCRAGSGTWNETSGNLQARVFDLTTTPGGTTPTSLPVQLFQLSTALAQSGTLQVTFGDLAADAGGQAVPAPLPFQAGTQTTLNLDKKDESIYGRFGFRLRAGTVTIDQTLATVQELSAPSELPKPYYGVASNYALLVVGDPTHKPTDSNYNPRRAVHMLAVPVLDPEKADGGGADASGDGG